MKTFASSPCAILEASTKCFNKKEANTTTSSACKICRIRCKITQLLKELQVSTICTPSHLSQFFDHISVDRFLADPQLHLPVG
eukprot:758078-Hanusia_phi.AAC.1